MHAWRQGMLVSILLVCGVSTLCAQELDANVTSRTRQSAAIADEIADAGERAAFIALFRKQDPAGLRRLSEGFLARFPRSAFLAQAYEIAAKSNFDLGEFAKGIDYARASLRLLPENPLLLVALADVEARDKDNDSAIRDAQSALDYLDEFAHPSSVAEADWPSVKKQQQAIAWFARGRAQLQKGLGESTGAIRKPLLTAALTSLSQARALNPSDPEIRYLDGMALMSNGDLAAGASEFAALYNEGGSFADRALATLRAIYTGEKRHSDTSFEAYLQRIRQSSESIGAPIVPAAPAQQASDRTYAGSRVCRSCHAEIYQNWSQTGMATMLRPYQFENVTGDFDKDNEFYTGDDTEYVHGQLTTVPEARRRLFARMFISSGRHYFKILETDGTWRTYPVDYTIGSKWQQAYATKLPNGEIHVFPVQYSMLQKRWINYWRSLDGPGTERSDPHNFERLDSSTNYQEKCAICHTSQLRNTKGGGLEGDGLTFREAGIGCEMCHGPSANHVAAMDSGEVVSQAANEPPVDFSRIDNQEFVVICAQCHMQSSLRQPGPHGELNYSPSGTFYQKCASVPLGEFTRKGFYKDGRFSQTTFIVEALRRTKCFQIGKISCGSCHDPHGHNFANNLTSLRYKDEPDKMCTGCHAQFQSAAATAAHSRHAAGSEGSRCIACHMPRIMDALTFSARTHQIDDIPDAAMTLRFGQVESPNACLLCHKDKSPQWVADQLKQWKPSAGAPNAVARTSE
jgi:predicted CXXCH cytochrome family protein